MKKKGCGGGCLGAPVRLLSRACDSACDLYVRGMSGCARRVPSGSSAGVVGRGFGGAGASSLRLRVSSDSADDLVRAAAAARRHQRRVAAEPAEEGVGYAAGKKGGDYGAGKKGGGAEAVGYYRATGKKGGGGGTALTSAPDVWDPARKKGGAAAMGTIAEDEPCEFGPDDACAAVPSPKPPRRAGFDAAKAGGNDAFAR